MKNGAEILPVRAKKPHVPNAAPRHIVGNSSELNIIMAAKAEIANAFVISERVVTIITEKVSKLKVN